MPGYGKPKLTAEEAAQIKKALKEGAKGSDLARKYLVSRQAICDINKNRTWKDV